MLNAHPPSYYSRAAFLLMVLLAAVGVQFGFGLVDHIYPVVVDIQTSRQASGLAVERSASLAFGDQFAGYIDFLRREIPTEKTAALPPSSEHIALGHTGLMQYFLFPRRTTNCPADQRPQKCLEQIGGPGVYVLQVGGFPEEQIRSRLDKPYLPFNGDWGLYLPTAKENSRR